jgi:hypothetical protein
MKISQAELDEVMHAATPAQIAELTDISKTFKVPMREICAHLLKLINTRFPTPSFLFSKN